MDQYHSRTPDNFLFREDNTSHDDNVHRNNGERNNVGYHNRCDNNDGNFGGDDNYHWRHNDYGRRNSNEDRKVYHNNQHDETTLQQKQLKRLV